MKIINKYILPIIILVFIYLYLTISMSGVAITSLGIEEEGGKSTNSIIGIAFFSFIFLFMSKRSYIIASEKCILEKSIRNLLVYIFVISVIYSFSIPFQTRNLYIVLALPMILYTVVKRYTLKYEEKQYLVTGFLVLFLFILYNYYQNYTIVHLVGSRTSANNASFFVLYLLPFVLCIQNNKLRFFFEALIIVAVTVSFKRGGVITLILGLLSFYYFKNIATNDSSKKLKYILIIIIVILIGLIIFTNINNDILSHLFDRFANIRSDGGSGRQESFTSTIQMIQDSGVISLLIGHGWNMVEYNSPMGISAHNDFLECLYDFGILGLLLYIKLYYSIYKKCLVYQANKSVFFAPLATSGVILFSGSLFSHIIIYPFYLLLFVIFWSYVLSKEKIQLHEDRNFNLPLGF